MSDTNNEVTIKLEKKNALVDETTNTEPIYCIKYDMYTPITQNIVNKTESIIGTWYNNSNIYRKLIEQTVDLTTRNTGSITLDVSPSIDTLVHYTIYDANNNDITPVITLDKTGLITKTTSSSISVSKVVIEYTKTGE